MRKPMTGYLKGSPGALYVLLLSALMFTLTGCLGIGTARIPETRHFVIDYVVPAKKASGPGIPVSVGVDNFRADSVYRSDRIIFRKDSYRVDYYPYERWGARPDEIVTDRMLDHLNALGRFRDVVRAAGGPKADILVRGRIKRFEEVERGGAFFAVLHIEYSVMDRRSGRVLYQGRLMGEEKASSKPPEGFVNAMAENLKKLLSQAAMQVAQVVADHLQQGGVRP